MCNIKVENYVLFGGQNWQAPNEASQIALRDFTKVVSRSQDIYVFLQQRPGSQNIERTLVIKEIQLSQVKGFSSFLCMGRCKSLVWTRWNHSFDSRFSHPALSHCAWAPGASLGVVMAAGCWWSACFHSESPPCSPSGVIVMWLMAATYFVYWYGRRFFIGTYAWRLRGFTRDSTHKDFRRNSQ